MTVDADKAPTAIRADSVQITSDVPGRTMGWGPKIGAWAWSFVGVVVALIIVAFALATVSEIVLPLTFAAVLAVCFKPVWRSLRRRGVKPNVASGLIVLGLIALFTILTVAIVRGVTDQTAQISASVDAAVDTAVVELDADEAMLESAREAVEGAAPFIGRGSLTELAEGINALIGLASGLILGALIMYYLLKDGSQIRRALVAKFGGTTRDEIDGFIGDACAILREYGRGRTIMSGMVAVFTGLVALLLGLPLVLAITLVTFIGGYIPYIGAFISGALAVVIAFGEGGLETAVIMLVAVIAANLVLENFVEPKVMSDKLDIHPMAVLLVTALGGLVGGIVGLILAVPLWVITLNAMGRLRRAGFFGRVKDRAEPTARHMLQ
jgi:putative heme transporter